MWLPKNIHGIPASGITSKIHAYERKKKTTNVKQPSKTKIVILENPEPFSLNFPSPMKCSFKERSSHIAPFPQPHPQTKKIPLKTSVHFQIIITVCKHWSKFVTCSPSSRDCRGVSHPQRHSYYSFLLFGTKWLSQNFDPLTLGKE